MVHTETGRVRVFDSSRGVTSAPGLLHSPPGATPARVETIAFDADRLIELHELPDRERLAELRRSGMAVWVDVVGLGSVEVVEEIGEVFELHRLALEDVLHLPQRSKLEDFETDQFVVARMVRSSERLETEQLSMFLGEGFVISFQERDGDCFNGVRGRIEEGRTRIRTKGADYLFYALLDALVDAYFPLLETLGRRLEGFERLAERGDRESLSKLGELRRDLITLRRYLEPLREISGTLARGNGSPLAEDVRPYMRDVHDHAANAVDISSSYRDIAQGLIELSVAVAGLRMNDVMRVLTVISTIFIPLSFVAGLYGMNFDRAASDLNMPELGWAYGYPMVLGVMLAIALGMLTLFWRRGWFR